MIACVHLPHFAASIQQRDDSRLAQRPVALVEAGEGAQIVTGVSQEAVASGAHPCMTLRQAQTLCADLQVIPANRIAARRSLDALLLVFSQLTPRVEAEEERRWTAGDRRKARPAIQEDGDAAIIYLDLGKLDQEEGLEAAHAIRRVVDEQVRLECSIALSSGKFTSRVIATSLPLRQVMLVMPGKEREFLAEFPATLLPIYPEKAHELSLLGLDTLGALARLPASAMLDLFGKKGRLFHRLAQGRDTSPVLPYEPPVTEQAAHQLDGPVADRNILENILRSLAEGLAHRLEQRGQVAGEVGLALTLEDRSALSAEISLRQPSGSAGHLAHTLIDLLTGLRIYAGVVEIEVLLSRVGEAQARQLSLFDLEYTPQDRLKAALDDLIARHGGDGFFWVDLADTSAYLPEQQFKLRRVDDQ